MPLDDKRHREHNPWSPIGKLHARGMLYGTRGERSINKQEVPLTAVTGAFCFELST